MMKTYFWFYILIINLLFLNIKIYSQDTIILPPVDIYGELPTQLNKINSIEPHTISYPQTDIGQTLKSLPNVSTVRRGGTALDPVFRGFRGSQLLVLTADGIQIEGGCPNRMDPVTSHIDVDEISKMSWVKGSNMLQYGSAIGGVLLLNTYQPEAFEKWTLKTKVKSGYESNFNGFNNSISLNGGNKKVFFLFSAGNKNYGNYTDGRGEVIKSSFQKNYYTLKTGFNINSLNTIRINYSRSEARDVLFPALQMDENHDFTDIFNISFNRKLKKELTDDFFANIYHVRVNHLMDNSHRPQYSQIVPPLTGKMQAVSEVDAFTTGLVIKKRYNFKKVNGIIGIDIVQIDKSGFRDRKMIMTMNGLTTESLKKDNLWQNACIRKGAVFGNLKYVFLKNPTFKENYISFNIRYDYAQNFSADTFLLNKNNELFFSNKIYTNHLFSFGGEYYLKIKDISLTFGLSRTMRHGNMNELYIKRMPVAFDNYDYLGNPTLKPEINNQIDFSFKYFSKNNFYIACNLFSSLVQDYIGSQILPPSVINAASMGVLGVKQFNNIGNAHFYGGELLINSPEKYPFEIKASTGYTYAYINEATKYLFSNNQVVGNEIIKNDPLPEIPAMNTLFTFLYKFNKPKIQPKIDIIYTLPQNFVSKANYESTTPDYMLLKFSIMYSFKSFLLLNIGVNNILNDDYYEHLNRRVISTNPSEKIKLYEPGRSFFVNLSLNF